MAEAKAREVVRGMDPTQIKEIDAVVGTCQNMTPPIAMAISMACCRAGARHSNNTPLYQFMADLVGSQPRIPVPVMNLVGRAAGGGIDVAQTVTCLPTTPSFFENALESLIAASRCVQAKLHELRTPATVPDLGCPVVLSDMQVDELLELVSAAIAEEGVEGVPKLGFDYRGCELMTPVASDDEIPNEDNSAQTYQLEGAEDTPMSGGDLSAILVGIWRKTGIITLEDPLSIKDTAVDEFVEKLDECIADIRNTMSGECAYNLKGIAGDAKCNLQIVADSNVQSPDDVAKVAFPFNTIKVTLDKGKGSVFAALEMCKAIKDKNMTLLVGCVEGKPETDDNFLADFAVAAGCSQFYGGGICNLEYSNKYTRLLEIADKDETLKYVGKAFRS